MLSNEITFHPGPLKMQNAYVASIVPVNKIKSPHNISNIIGVPEFGTVILGLTFCFQLGFSNSLLLNDSIQTSDLACSLACILVVGFSYVTLTYYLFSTLAWTPSFYNTLRTPNVQDLHSVFSISATFIDILYWVLDTKINPKRTVSLMVFHCRNYTNKLPF